MGGDTREDGNPTPVVRVEDLTKTYQMGSIDVHALRGVSFDVRPGEMVAIMGHSGSGKSTLLNLLGCLDAPTAGSYFLDGDLVGDLSDDELATIRNRKIGFVFQSFNLLARMSALEQVEMPLLYARERQRRQRAQEALALVGLADRTHHKPSELSGGQQQRVAIARALVGSPSMLLADEPTGNLDTSTANEIMDLLTSLNHEHGITTLIVTHEAGVAERTQRVIRMVDGTIAGDERTAHAGVAA